MTIETEDDVELTKPRDEVHVEPHLGAGPVSGKTSRPQCAVRMKFGRDTHKLLTRMGHRPAASGIPDSGSAWARSGRAVRSAPGKLRAFLRLTPAEQGSPSY